MPEECALGMFRSWNGATLIWQRERSGFKPKRPVEKPFFPSLSRSIVIGAKLLEGIRKGRYSPGRLLCGNVIFRPAHFPTNFTRFWPRLAWSRNAVTTAQAKDAARDVRRAGWGSIASGIRQRPG